VILRMSGFVGEALSSKRQQRYRCSTLDRSLRSPDYCMVGSSSRSRCPEHMTEEDVAVCGVRLLLPAAVGSTVGRSSDTWSDAGSPVAMACRQFRKPDLICEERRPIIRLLGSKAFETGSYPRQKDHYAKSSRLSTFCNPSTGRGYRTFLVYYFRISRFAILTSKSTVFHAYTIYNTLYCVFCVSLESPSSTLLLGETYFRNG